MRLAPIVASAAALVLAGVALSDPPPEPTPPTNPPQINLWRRSGNWTVTQDAAKPPLEFNRIYFEQPDVAPAGGGTPAPVGVVDAKPGQSVSGGDPTPIGITFAGVCAGTGKSIRGTSDAIVGTDLVKFAVKMNDDQDYERFTGKYFALGTTASGFSGKYVRPPVDQEEGVANLAFRMYVIKAAHNLSLTGLAKKQITSVRRDKGAKLAILAMAVNKGPDLLPTGVGRFEFVVSPGGDAFGFKIPFVWKLDRVVEPVHYRPGDVTNTSYLQYATVGALGQPKDRSVFAFELDVPAGLPTEITNIHVRLSMESNSPLFDLSGSRDAISGNVQAEAVIAIDDVKPL